MRALLALFVRSLKEDVRGRSTYIVRAALVLLVLFFLWITHSNSQWSGAVGRQFFSTVVWIDLFVLSVVGLTYFATSITEEKESETLGLLRMTDLDALSILMGKSTSRLLGALFILTAQLPFMLVAVTMGGLAVNQVLAGFVSLLAYVFLLSNIGLLCSVVAKRGGAATMFSAVIIVVLLVLPWLLAGSGVLINNTRLNQWLLKWAEATPFVQLDQVMQTGFDGAIFSFQVAASLVAGVLFFGFAWLLFDRFADSSNEKPTLGWLRKAKNGAAGVARRVQRAKLPALQWKDYYHVAGGTKAVIIKALLVGLIVYLCLPMLKFSIADAPMVFGGFVTVLTGSFLALCLALDASRVFKKEREERVLSSLMMLPYSARRVIWQKTIGCVKSSWPAFVGVGAGLSIIAYALLKEFNRTASPRISEMGEFAFYSTCMIGHAVFTGLFLPVFVAWLSLRMRWGALPIGLTIWFLGNFGAGAILGLLAQEGAMILLPILSFCLLICFWRTIPSKLEQLAAEE